MQELHQGVQHTEAWIQALERKVKVVRPIRNDLRKNIDRLLEELVGPLSLQTTRLVDEGKINKMEYIRR